MQNWKNIFSNDKHILVALSILNNLVRIDAIGSGCDIICEQKIKSIILNKISLSKLIH